MILISIIKMIKISFLLFEKEGNLFLLLKRNIAYYDLLYDIIKPIRI